MAKRIARRGLLTFNRRRIARCRSGSTEVDFANHMPFSARATGKGAALSWSCTLTARAACWSPSTAKEQAHGGVTRRAGGSAALELHNGGGSAKLSPQQYKEEAYSDASASSGGISSVLEACII